MAEIGTTLRETRMRAGIDVSEIEAHTKIRAKYLRALENEEWDLLPGPTYVRSFLRTYAQALGLDPKALLEEYRASHERSSEVEVAPIAPAGRGLRAGGPGRPGGPSRGYAIAVGGALLLIVLLLIGILSGGGKSKGKASSAARQRSGAGLRTATAPVAPQPVAPSRVSLQLAPSGPVYVCLIGDGGRKLIDKVILTPASPQPIYRARRFAITVGNSAVILRIDGRDVTVPPSNNATGYVLTRRGRHTLPLGQLPTCA
jgi:transcriptional regulator with XRE-family HTH domain